MISNSYLLSSKPYLFGCEYDNIITINILPRGPLAKIVRQINFSNNKLSDFSTYENTCRCGYALLSLRGTGIYGITNCNSRKKHHFMTADEIPDLFSFLLSNEYKIDTSLTKMMNSSNIQINMNNIIGFITYMQ